MNLTHVLVARHCAVVVELLLSCQASLALSTCCTWGGYASQPPSDVLTMGRTKLVCNYERTLPADARNYWTLSCIRCPNYSDFMAKSGFSIQGRNYFPFKLYFLGLKNGEWQIIFTIPATPLGTRHTTLPAACSCNISIKLLCFLSFPCLRLPQTNAGIIIRTVDPNFLSHTRKHPWISRQRDRQTSPHGEAVPFQNNIFGSTCWDRQDLGQAGGWLPFIWL